MNLHTLIFKLGSISGYFRDGAYSEVRQIDLSQTSFAALPVTLITWLGTQLASGESISDIILEPSSPVVASFTNSQQTITDPNGNTLTMNVQTPTAWRNTINAAVSVDSLNGARTTVVNSESLPSDLRDGLLTTWESLDR